jgi:sulfite exporter TauE/SafE
MYNMRKPKTGCDCKNDASTTATRIKRYGIDFGAFTLGFTRGLIICTPLILLLTTSLTLVDAAGSVAVAVLFGLGTSISPILVLGGLTGWLLNKAPLFRKWISIAGGLVLILLGALSVYSSLTQIT